MTSLSRPRPEETLKGWDMNCNKETLRMLMKIRKCFLRPVVSSSSKHCISSTHPIFYPVPFWYPGSRGFFSGIAFSIYQFVRVASQSRSWLTTRLTSDANNFVNVKTIPEKNLYAQSMFWRTSSKIKQNNIKT